MDIMFYRCCDAAATRRGVGLSRRKAKQVRAETLNDHSYWQERHISTWEQFQREANPFDVRLRRMRWTITSPRGKDPNPPKAKKVKPLDPKWLELPGAVLGEDEFVVARKDSFSWEFDPMDSVRYRRHIKRKLARIVRRGDRQAVKLAVSRGADVII